MESSKTHGEDQELKESGQNEEILQGEDSQPKDSGAVVKLTECEDSQTNDSDTDVKVAECEESQPKEFATDVKVTECEDSRPKEPGTDVKVAECEDSRPKEPGTDVKVAECEDSQPDDSGTDMKAAECEDCQPKESAMYEEIKQLENSQPEGLSTNKELTQYLLGNEDSASQFHKTISTTAESSSAAESQENVESESSVSDQPKPSLSPNQKTAEHVETGHFKSIEEIDDLDEILLAFKPGDLEDFDETFPASSDAIYTSGEPYVEEDIDLCLALDIEEENEARVAEDPENVCPFTTEEANRRSSLDSNAPPSVQGTEISEDPTPNVPPDSTVAGDADGLPVRSAADSSSAAESCYPTELLKENLLDPHRPTISPEAENSEDNDLLQKSGGSTSGAGDIPPVLESLDSAYVEGRILSVSDWDVTYGHISSTELPGKTLSSYPTEQELNTPENAEVETRDAISSDTEVDYRNFCSLEQREKDSCCYPEEEEPGDGDQLDVKRPKDSEDLSSQKTDDSAPIADSSILTSGDKETDHPNISSPEPGKDSRSSPAEQEPQDRNQLDLNKPEDSQDDSSQKADESTPIAISSILTSADTETDHPNTSSPEPEKDLCCYSTEEPQEKNQLELNKPADSEDHLLSQETDDSAKTEEIVSSTSYSEELEKWMDTYSDTEFDYRAIGQPKRPGKDSRSYRDEQEPRKEELDPEVEHSEDDPLQKTDYSVYAADDILCVSYISDLPEFGDVILSTSDSDIDYRHISLSEQPEEDSCSYSATEEERSYSDSNRTRTLETEHSEGFVTAFASSTADDEEVAESTVAFSTSEEDDGTASFPKQSGTEVTRTEVTDSSADSEVFFGEVTLREKLKYIEVGAIKNGLADFKSRFSKFQRSHSFP